MSSASKKFSFINPKVTFVEENESIRDTIKKMKEKTTLRHWR